MTAATARRLVPACPRDLGFLSPCCTNTPVPYKCMIPLQDSVEACGVPFIKTPGDLPRTQNSLSSAWTAAPPTPLNQPHRGMYARGGRFVPAVHVAPIREACKKLSISPA